MIIELEINGARVIISGDNLTVNLTQDDNAKAGLVAQRAVENRLPTPEEIKALRKRLMLTQSGFAQMLRVVQPMISKWELGTDRPTGDVAIRLASMVSEANEASGSTGLAALREWIKADRGRQTALAKAIDITTAAIPQWREVPADKLIAVERITGIKRQILRPDLFEGMAA